MKSALAHGYENPYICKRPTVAAAVVACLFSGTGGTSLPQRYTDGTAIAPPFAIYNDYSVSRKLREILETYKLGKDQLARC